MRSPRPAVNWACPRSSPTSRSASTHRGTSGSATSPPTSRWRSPVESAASPGTLPKRSSPPSRRGDPRCRAGGGGARLHQLPPAGRLAPRRAARGRRTGDAYGRAALTGVSAQVEFLSANPTGPCISGTHGTRPWGTRSRGCSRPRGSPWSASTTSTTPAARWSSSARRSRHATSS